MEEKDPVIRVRGGKVDSFTVLLVTIGSKSTAIAPRGQSVVVDIGKFENESVLEPRNENNNSHSEEQDE